MSESDPILPTINYETLVRDLLMDARRFASASAIVEFEIRKELQDNTDVFGQEKFAAQQFKRLVLALETLHIVNGMCDLLGLSLYKEKIVTLCAERLLGPSQSPNPSPTSRPE